MWSVLEKMAMTKGFELPLNTFKLIDDLFPEIINKSEVFRRPKVIDSTRFKVLY